MLAPILISLYTFDINGKILSEYTSEFWFTKKVECMFLTKEFFPGELISIDCIENEGVLKY